MTETVLQSHLDEGERKITFAVWQDVEDIIERNKKLQNSEQRSDWGRHVGSIPNVFITQWLNEEWNRGNTGLRPFTPEFDLIVERKLQDPDWRFLRTDKTWR